MKPALLADLQRALTLQGAGQLDAAARLCQRVMRKAPREADPQHLLGLIRKQQGRTAEAEKLLKSSIRLAPARANFHANLGNLMSNLGRHADAEKSYRQALSLDQQFRPARLGLARTLNAAEAHVAAEREARTLLTANPKDAEAMVALGLALAGQSRSEEAEAAYREALAVAPDYGAAHHNLGALLARMERIEESIESLDRAQETGVRGVEIDFNRASALMKLYEFEAGEALLADSVAANPTYAPAQKLLAQFRFMRGSAEFAGELGAAARRFADHTDLQLAHAQVLHGANQLEEAEAALQFALHNNPGQPRFLGMLASIYQEAGRYADALDAANAAIKSQPDDQRLVDFAIDALMSLGRADEAMPLIRAARERAPDQQWYIAIEATAARLLDDPLYTYLCDYEEMVRVYALEAPAPYQSMVDFHAALLPALHKKHQFYAHPLDQSLRQGTQTPRNLVGDPDPLIQAFLAALEEPIRRYREAIGHDPEHPLRRRNQGKARLTGCWSVRLTREGFHVNHVHPEGWISSAYYAEVPQEVADTNNKSGWIKFGEPRFPIPGAVPERFVQPQQGRLVLFPSYLWHGTVPIQGPEPRMTLAFDVVTDPR